MDPQANETPHKGPSSWSLAAMCALLGAILIPVALAVAWLCSSGNMTQTLLTAVVGASVCWSAAALALCTTWVANRLQSPVQGVLAAMLFRMGIPLFAIVVLPQLGGRFEEKSVTSTILAVYLVALVAETLLSLRLIKPMRLGTAALQVPTRSEA